MEESSSDLERLDPNIEMIIPLNVKKGSKSALPVQTPKKSKKKISF